MDRSVSVFHQVNGFFSLSEGMRSKYSALLITSVTSAAMLQRDWRLVLSRINERHWSEFAATVDERPLCSSQAVRCSSQDATGFSSVGGMRSTTSAFLIMCALVKMQIYSNVQVRLWRPRFPSYTATSPNWQLTAMCLVSLQK